MLGGGNARKLVNLPDAATRGSNENAIQGGVRLWERVAESTPPEFVDFRTASETLVHEGERRVGARRAADRAAALLETAETPMPAAPAKKAAATKRATSKRSS